MDVNEHTNEPLMESCYSSSQILEEGTPDKVTKKVLSEALERYTLADKEWKGSGKIKDQGRSRRPLIPVGKGYPG